MLAFEVLAGKPLMAPRSSPEEVAARLAGLALMDMAPVDLQLQPVLRSMLSSAPSQRPAVSTFCGSPYFQVRRPFALLAVCLTPHVRRLHAPCWQRGRGAAWKKHRKVLHRFWASSSISGYLISLKSL